MSELCVKKAWTLREFMARQRRLQPDARLKLQDYKDQEGNPFKSLCVWYPTIDDEGDTIKKVICLINFSSKLGELPAKEIAEGQDTLRVCWYGEEKYKLTQGFDEGEDIDI